MDEGLHCKEQPLVSVLICAYNGLPYIKEAVKCILSQTYKHWELIISDDGSNDGTRKWLADNFSNNPQIKLFFQTHNLGYVANKNFVHRQANGEYITQLDNDDTSAPDRLEKQVAVFTLNPTIKIVGCGYTRIDMEGIVYEEISVSKDRLLSQKPAGDYPFWFPSLMVHRSVLKEIGYFNEYFSGALGDDLYWTVKANRQYPIYCLKELLYGYRNNTHSITNQYNNLRKLIMPMILIKLFEQMETRGNDWLSEGNLVSLKNLEDDLVNDKFFIAEQYRIWSAKALDKNDLAQAWRLIWKAFKSNPGSHSNFRTLFYAIRKQLAFVTQSS